MSLPSLPHLLFLVLATVCWLGARFGSCQLVDLSQDPHIFESDSLPQNEQQVASVGNGHLATIVYTDTVYMNGLYNGVRGDSHRARIQSRINVRVAPVNQTVAQQRFSLDTEKGTFIERIVTGSGIVIEQRTFAHRTMTPLLVTQISADFSQSTAGNSVTLDLLVDSGVPSEDINLPAPVDYPLAPGKQQSGFTYEPEDPKFQTEPSPVTIIYSLVTDDVLLDQSNPMVTFIMSVASNYSEASDAYLNAIGMPAGELYQSHIDRWQAIWSSGNILLEGPNLQLAKVVRGSMYYLLSSLPSETVDSQRRRFSGLSPGSLANGAYLKDYQGHSFWDTETWMYPPVLMLWSYVAKDLLLYRMRNIEAARDRALQTGYQGARFPWESAFTGVEVTPDCCPETRDNQQHITGDISFAARQYWAATEDRKWMEGESYNFPLIINGCNFIREMAQFWASRAEYNSQTGQYEINGVMPPDEDHPFVNNSIYTNTIAAYSIFFAKHAECECGQAMSSSVPEGWLNVARQLKIPYDADLQYHPEFDGYLPGEIIKQADVVLLGFPIMYVKDPVTRRNDLDKYENVTRPDGPAMTWSMHAIGHLELGDDFRAEQLLNRSFQPYLIEPFKVWNEAMEQKGAYNFITGMGGFLQSILFGYGGFRLTVEKLTGNPKMPPGITKFTIQGLDYLGCSFDVIIQPSTVNITWTNGTGNCNDLAVEPTTSTESFEADQQPKTPPSYPLARQATPRLQMSRGPFTIRRLRPLTCQLPEDELMTGDKSRSPALLTPLLGYAQLLMVLLIVTLHA